MCRPTRCRSCGNTTWAGCGSHVAQVRANVPSGQWCNGNCSPSAADGASGGEGGLLKRLLNR